MLDEIITLHTRKLKKKCNKGKGISLINLNIIGLYRDHLWKAIMFRMITYSPTKTVPGTVCVYCFINVLNCYVNHLFID